MVFWVNSPFDPLPGEGGRPLRYWLLCRALTAAGHEVVWWSSDFHHLKKIGRPLEPVSSCEGFQLRLVPTLPYRSNVGWRRWRSHLRYATEWERLARAAVACGELVAPDGIVVSMPPLGLYDAASRLRDAWGCRVVVDIQDAWPETFYQLLPLWLRDLGQTVFCQLHAQAARAYCGADYVSAVCGRYAQLAQSRGCLTEPQVFRLGCPLPVVADRSAGSEAVLRLCYVGNLGASYDIRTMVEGVCELVAEGWPVTLDVAGDGPRREWVEAVAARDVSPLKFHGYVDDTRLQSCLRACQVGVVPMFSASWVAVPNKVADYAGAGLAMINGLTGETGELLLRYGAGIGYEAGNLESFKQAVRRYVEDRELLVKHQDGARRMAEELFDAGKIYPEMARWLKAKVERLNTKARGHGVEKIEPQRTHRTHSVRV